MATFTYEKLEVEKTRRRNAWLELGRILHKHRIPVPLCKVSLLMTGMQHVDIIQLDDLMLAHFGSAYGEGQESLANFMGRTYGPVAVELVRILI